MNREDLPTIIDCDWAFSYYENCRDRLPATSFPATPARAGNLVALADEIDVFVLDAFGVLNVGEGPVPGAVESIATLQRMGKKLIVLSNGATFNRDKAQAKYKSFGFDFPLEDIISSRMVLADELTSHRGDFQWGVAAIPEANLADFGPNFHLLGEEQNEYDNVDGFILLSSIGWSMDLHDKMLTSLINNPRPLLVGNPDVVAPREDKFSIEPGYYAHEIASQTKVVPGFYGKPFVNAFDAVKTKLAADGNNTDPARIAMVGDTLHTDILGGAAAGFRTILVEDHGLFRGEDSSGYIEASGIVPDFIVPTT